MNSYILNSASANIKIDIKSEDFINILKDEFLFSYIPGLEIKEENENYDATIKIIQGNEENIIYDYPNITYIYKVFNTKDIISLIEYVFERSRQEKGIICIHGAGSIVGDRLVVSWGTTTGMGKTTLALSLSEDSSSFYSDEKVLIDLNSKKAAGGISNLYISNDYWRKKFNTNEKYIHLVKNNQKNPYISMLIEPIICNTKDKTIDIWDESKFFWHLYEESSRKIRGTSRLFFDGTVPAESLDTKELATKRIKLIKEFVKEVPGIYFKGNIEDAVEEVKLFSKKLSNFKKITSLSN